MADFCLHCGASFPHRFGEGRCQHCLPRAFRELETAHQELVNDRAAIEAAFAAEPMTQALEEIKSIVEKILGEA